MNHIGLTGRLTRDPELRYTQSGDAVTSFSLAVDRDYTTKDGNRDTDFFDIVAWRNTALFVSKYFKKGRKVAIDGRLQSRLWEDKDGSKRKAVEVVASHVEFADGKPSDAEAEASPTENAELAGADAAAD